MATETDAGGHPAVVAGGSRTMNPFIASVVDNAGSDFSRHVCHAAERIGAEDDATRVALDKSRLELSDGVRIGSNSEESNTLSRRKPRS